MTAIDRFLAKAEWSEHRHDGTRCLDWTGYIQPNGYGKFRFGERMVYAHRWLYEHWFGPIADGLEPDHLCRRRCCVNPGHIEPVTHMENVRRGQGGANNRLKTHCPAGHPYDELNTAVDRRGCRRCLTCDRSR